MAFCSFTVFGMRFFTFALNWLKFSFLISLMFSITAVVWRPGQQTRIHDHTTWCVFGVIQGVEHEDVYDAALELIGSRDEHVGDVNGFAPPGDIHRVHNTGDEVAISIHVYGTDVTRIGSSVRRYYD